MTDCKHRFFLQDFAGNSERISAEVGDDWRVTCGHCGQSVAGSRSGESAPVALRWSQAQAWFGELGAAT
jgi:hypothetical protein